MIRDLVRISVDMVKQEKIEEIREKAKSNVEEKVLDLLLPPSRRRENALAEGDYDRFLETREKLRKQLRDGILDDRLVEIEVKERMTSPLAVFSNQGVEGFGFPCRAILAGFRA